MRGEAVSSRSEKKGRACKTQGKSGLRQSQGSCARAKGPVPANWNLNDLCAMVSWFKWPGDSKVPQRKEDLIFWYLLTCTHSEQEWNRLKEGEQPVVDEEGVDGGDGKGEGGEGGAEEWASSPLHIFLHKYSFDHGLWWKKDCVVSFAILGCHLASPYMNNIKYISVRTTI